MVVVVVVAAMAIDVVLLTDLVLMMIDEVVLMMIDDVVLLMMIDVVVVDDADDGLALVDQLAVALYLCHLQIYYYQ